MSGPHEQAGPEDPLDDIIAAYEQAETQTHQSKQEWLARYPELANGLAEYFANREWAGKLTPETGLRKIKSLGKYELLEEIGRGGMGIVYKARQPGLERIVAVKTILGGQLATESDVIRFHREARLAASLRHPNIVTIHEVGEQEGLHFFSMEYVEGTSLAERTRQSPLEPDQAARYLQQIAEAIHYAHQQGVLHRDLKPSNILIDSSDRPKVADFGLAKVVKQDSKGTVRGAILGTPSYMSPEQADGRQDEVNERSDVYSLGAVLYETVTGKPPFRGKTHDETRQHVIKVPPVPPRYLNPGVPADLEAISLKCLEKDPDKRYQSARELAEDLRRFRDGKGSLARPPSIWDTLRRYSAIARLETTVSSIGLFAGPIIALLIGLGPLLGFSLAPGRPELNTMAAVLALMAIWWLTEAIPYAATAFLPLILLPLLGIVPLADVSKLYMHDVIIESLGGFLIIIALEESGLVRRMALRIVAWTGDNPRRILLGIMMATGGISLWVSSVAGTIIMLPIALGVLSEIEERVPAAKTTKNLGTALMLGIAYAAVIGGTATPVGRRGIMAFLSSYGEILRITSLGWMAVGVPFALSIGFVAWILLTRLFPLSAEPLLGGQTGVLEKRKKLGTMSIPEQRMLVIVLVTPLLWMLSGLWAPPLGLARKDANAIVAMAMAVVCFLLPAGGQRKQRLLEWEWTTRVPWGMLFLYGGGLGLAEGIKSAGLGSYLGNTLASILQGVPSDTGKMLGTATFVATLTQMMSNFAVVQVTSPILLQVANQLSVEPRLLVVSGVLAAYCSFMLPSATVANAIVYGSGKVAVRDMMKVGFWLTLSGIVLAVVFVRLLVV